MKKTGPKTVAILILFMTLGFGGCERNKDTEKKSNFIAPQEDDIVAIIEDSDYEKMSSDTGWANATEDSILVVPDAFLDSTVEVKKAFARTDILRIQGVASISWKGVSGCCSGKTPNQKAKRAVEAWVGQQILANRPHQYYRSGPIGNLAQAKCSRKTDWRGVSKCKGSWKQSYFIEFIKK